MLQLSRLTGIILSSLLTNQETWSQSSGEVYRLKNFEEDVDRNKVHK